MTPETKAKFQDWLSYQRALKVLTNLGAWGIYRDDHLVLKVGKYERRYSLDYYVTWDRCYAAAVEALLR